MKVLLWLFPLFAASCQSLKSFPADDSHSNSRWLEMGAGSFDSTCRLVITDDTLVLESYRRANWGRNEARHLIAEQHIYPLSPGAARKFWSRVDQLDIHHWTGNDIPRPTVSLSMSYRKGRQEISLTDFQSTRRRLVPGENAEQETYPRYDRLNRLIRDFEKEVIPPTKPAW